MEPDLAAARRELATAKRHLDSAAAVAQDDPTGALGLAYEAARKAIAAHLRSGGLRVAGGEGAHARLGEYGEAAFDDPAVAGHFRAFGRIRQLRNRSQYDALLVEEADVTYALENAQAIVGAVERDLA